jgi:DNA uptake protein ComE-like DNA-binding protein
MVQVQSWRFFVATVFLGACLTASRAAERDQKPGAADTIKIPAPTAIKPVDINSGSIEQLRALPGIHYRYAEKIIAGRPYQKKQELLSRKIIPEPVFEKIKNRIITVNQEAKPSNN